MYTEYFTGFSWLNQVPDIETLEFRVLKRNERYEIREVEVCTVSSVILFSIMVMVMMVLVKKSC